MTQDEALALLKTGASMFLTGQPGTGKTHTINRYIDYLRRSGIEATFTASTGIAATHGHGVTIHAWSGIGVRDSLSRRDLDGLATNRRLAGRIEKAKVLVIDEISMLPANTLSLVDQVCRHLKDSSAPFGGMQVVLVGDFFQLPPVVRRNDHAAALPFGDAENFGASFAHASPAWRDLAPMVCYLSEQHRQNDQAFLSILAAIRANRCTGAERDRLAARMIGRDALPDDCTRLFTHNASVDDINQQELAKLRGKARHFAMTSKGPDPFVQALGRGCLSPASLELKEDAVVMFTKNDAGGRYVNGTLGIVEQFDAETGLPTVKTRAGRRIFAEPATWKIEENGKERASITQIPLRLAWAITVHKSQGMSLDEAVIDLSRAFEYGQGYVALSRVRALTGLHLLGLNERALRVHPAAVEKDAAFRAESEDASRELHAMTEGDLASRHDAFLETAGGNGASRQDRPGATRVSHYPKSYEVERLRQTHASAYAPWRAEDEANLKHRHQAGERIEAIAAAFGRKPGAIRSRLKKMGLL